MDRPQGDIAYIFGTVRTADDAEAEYWDERGKSERFEEAAIETKQNHRKGHAMSSSLSISIPERLWIPISAVPKDGTVVFIRDVTGRVDLGAYDGEWNCELGTVEKPESFAKVSIATPPDSNGRCGRCGRYRVGP